MKKGKQIKVVIVEDHLIVKEGLRSLLEKQTDIEVIDEVDDGRVAVECVLKTLPDVVIMDIGLSELNGIEATRQIMGKKPDVKILALSMYSDKRFVIGMLKAGASGYMLKDSAFMELVNAIHVVADGKTYISPGIAGIVTEDYLKCLSDDKDIIARTILSPREIEVLQLMVEGNPTKQIASSLHISIKTVETHRQKIMKKIQVNNIVDLTKYAIREGITSL